jgi:hypothetical protein
MPKAGSFWFTRIVLEPAFVLITATVMSRIFIFQSGLVTYLDVAALALAMKTSSDGIARGNTSERFSICAMPGRSSPR